jgi:hypothetical protein
VVRRAERWEALARTEAAELNGMDRQTLRDRVHRFNAFGVEGLKSRRSSSRAPALTQLQRAELLDLVITGPDPEVHGMVRWRCVDLRTEVARRFWVEVHESTNGPTRLQPGPYHQRKDPEADETFKKTSPAWSKPRYPRRAPAGRSRSGFVCGRPPPRKIIGQ